MSADQNPLIDDLTNRQLIAQMTAEDQLHAHLNEQPRTVYCGFDPTADSLHIGSLVPLLALRRFQLAGHKPVALVGGATGMIGDPSFKAAERKLNTPEIIQEWTEKIRQQVSRFIDFDSGAGQALVVNNYEWTKQLDVLTFLRDVGKHFAVNMMINKESVKQRIQREGEGISYTEFSYMLLQSYDFAELYKQYGCSVQIGGSDQWGNITGGIDLTRRLHNAQVYGLTLPLITKSDGTKFGKTEAGTVWLDANRTSPYAFYQFWINTADADVYRFLKYFTFLPVENIVQIELEDGQAQGPKQAQKILAREVTRLVHGDEGYKAAERISQALFSGELDALSESDLLQLKQDGLPCTLLNEAELKDKSLIQLCVEGELASSGKPVKDALGRKAILVNGRPLTMEDNMKAEEVFSERYALYGRFFIMRMGKKKYHLFECAC